MCRDSSYITKNVCLTWTGWVSFFFFLSCLGLLVIINLQALMSSMGTSVVFFPHLQSAILKVQLQEPTSNQYLELKIGFYVHFKFPKQLVTLQDFLLFKGCVCFCNPFWGKSQVKYHQFLARSKKKKVPTLEIPQQHASGHKVPVQGSSG